MKYVLLVSGLLLACQQRPLRGDPVEIACQWGHQEGRLGPVYDVRPTRDGGYSFLFKADMGIDYLPGPCTTRPWHEAAD